MYKRMRRECDVIDSLYVPLRFLWNTGEVIFSLCSECRCILVHEPRYMRKGFTALRVDLCEGVRVVNMVSVLGRQETADSRLIPGDDARRHTSRINGGSLVHVCHIFSQVDGL